MTQYTPHIAAVVPAAGVGKRMGAEVPKQYLKLNQVTILEHTVNLLLSHPAISRVVVAVSDEDPYFNQLPIANHARVERVSGGAERVDSVLSGLNAIDEEWVMVHDAARPCVLNTDIDRLIDQAKQAKWGAILATPVRDTMKRTRADDHIDHTVCREQLWHALTPQMFSTKQLLSATQTAMSEGATITDDASAIEYVGGQPLIVEGRSDNLKITRPEDLALAGFYLRQREESTT